MSVKNIRESLFYAKILLFGEYSVVKDGKALSIPYDAHRGTLTISSVSQDDSETNSLSPLQARSNEHLREYLSHLEAMQNDGTALLDLDRMRKEVEEGMYFDSTIPIGYGVGSSGALVSAVYDRYAIDKVSRDDISPNKIRELKETFAAMESFFHGTSSGADPLICYLNIPLLIQPNATIDKVMMPQLKTKEDYSLAVFLLDTQVARETPPLMQHFLEKCKKVGFVKILKEQLVKYNDACVKAFLAGDIKPLAENIKFLSLFIYENLSPMIPKSLRGIWEYGMRTNLYYLKLCGAGGGGYMLGFSTDWDKTQATLHKHPLELLFYV